MSSGIIQIRFVSIHTKTTRRNTLHKYTFHTRTTYFTRVSRSVSANSDERFLLPRDLLLRRVGLLLPPLVVTVLPLMVPPLPSFSRASLSRGAPRCLPF